MSNSKKDESSLLELAFSILLFFIQHGIHIGTYIYCCGYKISFDAYSNRLNVMPSAGEKVTQAMGSVLTIETTFYSLIPLDPSFLDISRKEMGNR